MKQRSRKAKGSRLEKWVVDQLKSAGIPARKQPMSGALQDFPHDVCGELPDGRFIVEAKARKEAAWKTGDRWLGQADLLVVKRDYADPCVYMPWNFFARLVGLANGGCDDKLSHRPVSKGVDSGGHIFHTGTRTFSADDHLGVRLGEESMEKWRRNHPKDYPPRINAPQSLLTGEPKPKRKPNQWPKRKVGQ